MNLTNWAENFSYGAARVHEPENAEDVQELVRCHANVKPLGTRHSFNDIADTDADLISVGRLNKIVKVDGKAMTVTVGAGTRYGELCRELNSQGFAIHNLASLPHISVAGACATGTHGSGAGNGNLATAVCGLKLVKANGDLVSVAVGDPDFKGAVVGLGALGVVTELTLELQRAFEVMQAVYQRLPFGRFEQHVDDVLSGAYSISLFTDWREERFTQVWLKRRVDSGTSFEPEFFGGQLANRKLHPIINHDVECCTEQNGIAGPWHERLPHFRLEYTPSSGVELQSEYFVDREDAVGAIRAIWDLRSRLEPHLHISEIRAIAADDLWMSPQYGRETLSIHFTWKRHIEEVAKLLPAIEEALSPFEARPHWGKLFALPTESLRPLYPKLGEFQSLVSRFDPEGKFVNRFLRKYII